jgi:deoxyadenosine/deoxycytidine kinase
MSTNERRHVIIAGNIGVGKSTLVSIVAETLGWTPMYELEGVHPYLDDYYADPQRWGFHSQIWFLTRRLSQHQQIARAAGAIVQDRSIYEDARVFAASLAEQGILSRREYSTYQQLYGAIERELQPPARIVYLRASVPTLLERIARRARPAERSIQGAYLASLERHYADWIAGWTDCPVLTIDTDNLDLTQDSDAQAEVIGRLTASLRERGRAGGP